MAKHKRGAMKGLFCSVAGSPKCKCSTPHDYRASAESAGTRWQAAAAAQFASVGAANVSIAQYIQAHRKRGATWRSVEAHHIASVAAVTGHITNNPEIEAIVKNTQWCVNHPGNMIALPRWDHTLIWYLDLRQLGITNAEPPPFAGLALHDHDHAAYLDEVATYLESVAGKVARAAQATECGTGPSDGLLAELEATISTYGPGLKGRGTHAAWHSAKTNSSWYVAFSMWQDGASERTFPMTSGDLLDKVAEILRLLTIL